MAGFARVVNQFKSFLNCQSRIKLGASKIISRSCQVYSVIWNGVDNTQWYVAIILVGMWRYKKLSDYVQILYASVAVFRKAVRVDDVNW